MNPPYLLYETSTKTTAGIGHAVDVIDMHDGEIEGFTEFWLHDDKGAAANSTAPTTTAFGLDGNGFVRHRTGSDGRYGANPERVQLLSTKGVTPGTAFSQVANQFADASVWTSDHRGDGKALVAKIAYHGDAATFARVFPNGDPLVTATGKWQKLWDPRDEDQDREDVSTHVWSRNTALQLLHYLCIAPGGLRIDYETWIEPHIDTWSAAADVCDETVSLKGGGSEARYASGGGFYWTDDPAQTIANMLIAMDGKLLPALDGAYCLYAGKFVPPTVILTDRDIIRSGLNLTYQRTDDQRVNELQLQYTDRDKQWQVVDAPAWRDEDDIDDTGQTRSQTLRSEWTQSAATIQRLGKRRFMRLTAPWFGEIPVNLYGLKAMGQPTVRLQCPDLAAETGIAEFADMIFEVDDADDDFKALTATLKVFSAPDLVDGVSPLDTWNPATEEATATSPRAKVPETVLDAPTITGATVTGDGASARVAIAVSLPTGIEYVGGLTWILAWRTSSSDAWGDDRHYTGLPDGATASLVSGAVPQRALQFRAQYMLHDHRRSDWSDPYDVAAGITTPAVSTLTSATSVAQSTASAASSAATSAGTAASVADSKAAAASAVASATSVATSAVTSTASALTSATSALNSDVSRAFSSLSDLSGADTSLAGAIASYGASASSSLATQSAAIASGVVVQTTQSAALAAAALSLAAETSTVAATASAGLASIVVVQSAEGSARTAADTSLQTRVSTEEAARAAGVFSVAATVADVSGAAASTQIVVSAGFSTASSSTSIAVSIVAAALADALGNLIGSFGIGVDVDGVFTGLTGLGADVAGTTLSQLILSAADFLIKDPTLGNRTVLEVVGGNVYIGGNLVPTGALLSGAAHTYATDFHDYGALTAQTSTANNWLATRSVTLTTTGTELLFVIGESLFNTANQGRSRFKVNRTDTGAEVVAPTFQFADNTDEFNGAAIGFYAAPNGTVTYQLSQRGNGSDNIRLHTDRLTILILKRV